MVPGSNLLNAALRLIQPQPLMHEAFVSRTTNAIGSWVSLYAAPVAITGSMQPVDKKLYEALGLDLSRSYFTLLTSADVLPLARDRAGDRLTYAGKVFECESDTDWRNADGWRRLLCVEVPA